MSETLESSEVILEAVPETLQETIQEPTKPEIVYTDVIQVGPQTGHRAYIYNITMPDDNNFFATILAQTSTGANDALKQQFPNAVYRYLGKTTVIMQVNG